MYYPLSQIKPNLYTNGGEFTISSTGANYIGYYFKTSDGKYFTGKNQNDLPNQPLSLKTTYSPPSPASSPFIENIIVDNTDYSTINNIDLDKITIIPTYAPTFPTQQDYQIGEFRRFFCKKTNEIQYIEIQQEMYTKLVSRDPQVLWSLYFPFNIPWVIIGDKEKVTHTNRNIVELTMKQFKLPRFNDYLKNDYTKYLI